MQYPICAISKAKYLTRGGWINFKNQSDFEIPFQIHRENGHIMLLVSSLFHEYLFLLSQSDFIQFISYKILIKINQFFLLINTYFNKLNRINYIYMTIYLYSSTFNPDN